MGRRNYLTYLATTANDGKTYPVDCYDLDVINLRLAIA
jgi:hypothetical protein